jgi:endoglucanase
MLPVNPSYFAPYAYRVFATADPTRDWDALLDDSYHLLGRITDADDMGGEAGVIPNWVLVDPDDGALSRGTAVADDADLFSYDAGRLQWRLALDWLWNQDQRAIRGLRSVNHAAEQARSFGRVFAAYGLDGQPVGSGESTAMYAWTVPSLLAQGHDRVAHTMFAERVLAPSIGTSRPPDGPSYYDSNWAWFTAALVHGGLTDLYAGNRVMAWPANDEG